MCIFSTEFSDSSPALFSSPDSEAPANGTLEARNLAHEAPAKSRKPKACDFTLRIR